MYEFFTISCREKSVLPKKFWYYRNVFHIEFNLAFHKPHKVQCDTCFKCMNFDNIHKSAHQDVQNNYLERKDLSRQIKNSLKEDLKIEKCHMLV